jgi:hypothetical protein
MEFKYGGVPDETFNKKQDVPQSFFYYVKAVAFPRVYWWFATKGKWFGKRTILPPKFI